MRPWRTAGLRNHHHLTLATNQHLASKGGYLVRFQDPQGPKLAADGGWIVP